MSYNSGRMNNLFVEKNEFLQVFNNMQQDRIKIANTSQQN